MVGGTGAIRFLGFGSENTEGRGEINGKPKYIKVGDMSTYSFDNARVIQHWVEGLSKGVSMGEDGNIKGCFKKGNPTTLHTYKKFGLYPKTYLSDELSVQSILKDTMLPKSEVKQFDKNREYDSILLVPLRDNINNSMK